MKFTDLVGRERAHDGVQNTTIVEEDKVFLIPVKPSARVQRRFENHGANQSCG